MSAAATPVASPKVDKPWRKFSVRQRISLWLITWAGYSVIRLLGPTIRFAVSWEDTSPKSLAERPFVYSFWHNCMIAAMYWCRDLQVRVMSSDSFDGEYTGRIMQKFGFVKVRGSSWMRLEKLPTRALSPGPRSLTKAPLVQKSRTPRLVQIPSQKQKE